jgi:hypothetical protein
MADAYNGLWSLTEADFVPITAEGAFRAVYGRMEFAYSTTQEEYNGKAIGARANNAHKITFYAAGANASAASFVYNVAHELGHAFNGNALSPDPTRDNPNRRTGQPYRDLLNGGISVNGRQIAGGTPYTRTALGYQLGPGNSQYPYRQNTAATPGEDFGDMFANWTFNSFTNDIYGAHRYNWMNNHMPGWMALAVAPNQ